MKTFKISAFVAVIMLFVAGLSFAAVGLDSGTKDKGAAVSKTVDADVDVDGTAIVACRWVPCASYCSVPQYCRSNQSNPLYALCYGGANNCPTQQACCPPQN